MFFNFGGIPFTGGAGPEMFFEDGGANFNAPPPNPAEDYYKTLGVDEKASEDELKKSYRRLSMLHHPDKNGNTDESKQKFQELNNAYETLSDANKRRMYDMMRRGGGGGGHGMPPGGGHPFEHVFHFGGGGMRPPNGHASQFPPGIPEELLHMLFGQGVGGQGQGPKVVFQSFNPGMRGGGPMPQHPPGMPPRFQTQATPPESIIKTVSLTLEQCFNGCTIPLEIDRQIPDNDIVKIEKETIHAQIPKGVLQGDTIILNECGHMNEFGMKGDIRIIVNILQHPVFKVEHLDLHIEKNIPLKLALCGFDFEINHLNGKVFKLANKPGNVIKPGSIKTIPGLGLEKNGETGSLKIKFNIDFPDTLTSEQIQVLSNGL
jgi:DnaJ-class molecular chaperone